MRRILVTGANKGIGLAIVEAILRHAEDTFVFLGSRDAARGQAAAAKLAASGVPGAKDRVEVVALDVSDDTSVTEAKKHVSDRLAKLGADKPSGEKTGEKLYGVVNNAGIGHGAGDRKALMNTNMLGVHRVIEAFLPLIDPKGGRVVNVTSAAGPNFVATCSPERQRFFLDADGTNTWPKLKSFIDECIEMNTASKEAFESKGLADGAPYGLSKACANTYTLLVAREHPNLHVNACTPGFIETDMTRSYATSQNKSPAEVGMKPPSEGAKSTLHLLFNELEGNGRYYGSDAKRSPLDKYRAPGSPEYQGGDRSIGRSAIGRSSGSID